MSQEQRLTFRLKAYWDKAKKANAMPDIRHFNSAVIEDLWPNCFQVSLMPGTQISYKYDYMGRPLIDLYGKDLTGMMLDEHSPEFPGMIIHKKLLGVVQSGVPLQDEGNFLTRQSKMIKYRACLLPFGTAADGVTHIIVGLSYRAF